MDPGKATGVDNVDRKNLLLLVQLRWLAVAGQIVTIAFVTLALGVKLPLLPMGAVLGGLAVLNLASLLYLSYGRQPAPAILPLVLLLDVLALTIQLGLSGGATNPFTTLYLLQITLAAVLLDQRLTWTLVALASLLFAALTQFYLPLPLPAFSMPDQLYMTGMFVGLTLDAVLVVIFVTRITRNLRDRDAHLAALRQRAVEDDHIVRMGLLASGAAHELGTPLSSIAVILGDWRQMPQLVSDPELAQEIDAMQKAVARCKAIVTDILMSSGQARGEAPKLTSVRRFADALVDEWRTGLSFDDLTYTNSFGEDLTIVSDATLKQVLMNVLDNALEASPEWVGFDVAREGDSLVMTVTDQGSGFDPDMLADFGRPYRSSKGRKGRGLGLFLVVNSVSKLGGSVSARNRDEGGAVVTLRLPLETLTVGARTEGASDGQ